MSDAVALKVKIITGARDGPDLLVIGGVHGDEFESMAAIRRLIAAVDPLQLRGRLICIPVVNEPAYWRGQRTAETNSTWPAPVQAAPTDQSPNASPMLSAPISARATILSTCTAAAW